MKQAACCALKVGCSLQAFVLYEIPRLHPLFSACSDRRIEELETALRRASNPVINLKLVPR
jgi:hypothetical protein